VYLAAIGDHGLWADVRSCHRGSSSVLRLPGMRKPRVSGSSSGWRAQFCGGGSYHACLLSVYWYWRILYPNGREYSGVVWYSKELNVATTCVWSLFAMLCCVLMWQGSIDKIRSPRLYIHNLSAQTAPLKSTLITPTSCSDHTYSNAGLTIIFQRCLLIRHLPSQHILSLPCVAVAKRSLCGYSLTAILMLPEPFLS
jgi:hypothetical protein